MHYTYTHIFYGAHTKPGMPARCETCPLAHPPQFRVEEYVGVATRKPITCAHTYINLLAHMHGGLTFGNCTYSCVIFAKVLLYFLHFTTKKWLQIGKYCNFPRILLRYHTIRPIYSTESPPAGLGSGIIHGFHLFSPSNWRIPKIIRSLCQ